MSRLIKSISLILPNIENAENTFEIFWKKKENQYKLKEFLKDKKKLKTKRINDYQEFQKRFCKIPIPTLRKPIIKFQPQGLPKLRKKFYSSISSEINSCRKEELTKDVSVQVESSSILTNTSFGHSSFLYRSNQSPENKDIKKKLHLNFKKTPLKLTPIESPRISKNYSQPKQMNISNVNFNYMRIKKIKKVKLRSQEFGGGLMFQNPIIQDKIFSKGNFINLQLN